jgi:hypothetical protein
MFHPLSLRAFLVGPLATLALLVLLPVTAGAIAPKVETFHDEGSFTIGPCPSGVNLVETFTEDDRMITFFDQAGHPVSVQLHFNYEGVVTNPDTGQSVKDPLHATRFIDLTTGFHGPVGLYYSVTVPGLGVVFHDVGRLVRDVDDNVIFEAGPHDVLQFGDVALYCAALGA